MAGGGRLFRVMLFHSGVSLTPFIREEMDNPMIEGTVKWFDVKKGFGFLEGPDGQDVFIHFSSIIGDGFRTLKDGERVRYELHSGEKGDFAKNVERFTKADNEVPKSHGNGTGRITDHDNDPGSHVSDAAEGQLASHAGNGVDHGDRF